jgi:hypothetical protein
VNGLQLMRSGLPDMFLHVFDMDRFYTMDGTEPIKLATRLTKYYEFQCDDRVAVHIVYRNRGFKHAATYNQFVDSADDVLHWCQTLAPDSYILGHGGSILFKDLEVATQFKLTFG